MYASGNHMGNKRLKPPNYPFTISLINHSISSGSPHRNKLILIPATDSFADTLLHNWLAASHFATFILGLFLLMTVKIIKPGLR